jgi:hypothetical protein
MKSTRGGASQKEDDEIKETWIKNIESMFPGFERKWIRYFLIHRERYVEPLHWLNSTDLIPPIETPVKNLYLATTAQIYPALTNDESVSRHARQAAQIVAHGAVPSFVPAGIAAQKALADGAA